MDDVQALNEQVFKTVRFRYYKGHGIGAWIIRARLGSKFNHVGIELDGGTYVDSTMRNGGVKFRPKPKDVLYTTEIHIPEDRYNKVVEYINDVRDTPYDKVALLGFLWGSKKQSSDKLSCPEVARIVFEKGTNTKIKLFTLMTPGEHRIMVDSYDQGIQVSATGIF